MTIHTPKASQKAAERLNELFSHPVVMLKKSKSGEKETDITKLIRSFDASYDSVNGTLSIVTETACDNANYLNPSYIADAAARDTDLFTDDTWIETVRTAFLRADGTEFR